MTKETTLRDLLKAEEVANAAKYTNIDLDKPVQFLTWYDFAHLVNVFNDFKSVGGLNAAGVAEFAVKVLSHRLWQIKGELPPQAIQVTR